MPGKELQNMLKNHIVKRLQLILFALFFFMNADFLTLRPQFNDEMRAIFFDEETHQKGKRMRSARFFGSEFDSEMPKRLVIHMHGPGQGIKAVVGVEVFAYRGQSRGIQLRILKNDDGIADKHGILLQILTYALSFLSEIISDTLFDFYWFGKRR